MSIDSKKRRIVFAVKRISKLLYNMGLHRNINIKYYLKIICIGLFVGCATIVSKLIPLKSLPMPTGEYSIGTQIITWIDDNREEAFTVEVGDKRKLVIQVWYPATQSGKDFYPYIDNPELRIGPIAKRIEVPAALISGIKNVRTHSELNADPIVGQYPLIIFSHGLGGMKVQNTIQIEELVSNGYIVVAPDHTYDANITIFEDGSVAEFKAGYDESRTYTEEEFYAFRIPQIRIRAADISFVLDQIESLKESGSLWSNINMDHIGIFGHSFGGGTAIVSSYNDDRLDVCITLDSWIKPVPSNIINDGLNTPFLFIGQEKWDDPINYQKLDTLIGNCSSEREKILLKDTKHFDYTDSPYFSDITKKVGISGSMPATEIVDSLNHHIARFFEKHLMAE